MFGSEDVSRVVLRVRGELGLDNSIQPRIVETHHDVGTDTLLLIAADRPDKSAILGPRGWVLSKVKRELGVKWVGVRSKIDIEVKRLRISLAIERLREIVSRADDFLGSVISERLVPMLKNELNYPARSLFEDEPLGRHAAVVAFSGGVDSMAALFLSWMAGLNPMAVTISPGTWMVPPETREVISNVTKDLGIPHTYVNESTGYDVVMGLTIEGRIHPCGRCHSLTEKFVVEFARERGIPIVCFGDLLPTGGYSARLVEGGILRFGVPAALAFSKTDTIILARRYGHPGTKFMYGCPLLKGAQRRYHDIRYGSVRRVLREARAGVLEPGQALRYVKSIFREKA